MVSERKRPLIKSPAQILHYACHAGNDNSKSMFSKERRHREEKKRKDCTAQVQLRAFRKGPLTATRNKEHHSKSTHGFIHVEQVLITPGWDPITLCYAVSKHSSHPPHSRALGQVQPVDFHSTLAMM
eukprot:1137677-Pelagomonas_calceolata.AAC.4